LNDFEIAPANLGIFDARNGFFSIWKESISARQNGKTNKNLSGQLFLKS